MFLSWRIDQFSFTAENAKHAERFVICYWFTSPSPFLQRRQAVKGGEQFKEG
jgi:hypothetical protein